MKNLEQQGEAARRAARVMMTASTGQKNEALAGMAQALLDGCADILAANREDLEAARQGGMSEAMLDRLALSEKRVQDMAEGIRQVQALPDPVGEIVEGSVRPNGLQVQKVRVPLGVIGMIYEARPNVTSDAAALCLKAGNVVILRGGKEAIRSNTAIVSALSRGLEKAGASRRVRPAGGRHLARERNGHDANERRAGCAHPERRRRPDQERGGRIPACRSSRRALATAISLSTRRPI